MSFRTRLRVSSSLSPFDLEFLAFPGIWREESQASERGYGNQCSRLSRNLVRTCRFLWLICYNLPDKCLLYLMRFVSFPLAFLFCHVHLQVILSFASLKYFTFLFSFSISACNYKTNCPSLTGLSLHATFAFVGFSSEVAFKFFFAMRSCLHLDFFTFIDLLSKWLNVVLKYLR